MTPPASVLLRDVVAAPIVYGIVQPGPDTFGGVPFVQTRDLRRPLEAAQLNHTSREIADAYSRSTLRGGDLVFALRGDIGATQRVPPELNGANISRGVARIRVSKKFDADYVRQALRSESALRDIARMSGGSALAEISINALRRIAIPVVPLDEQRKIAAILRTWDDAIDELLASAGMARSRADTLARTLLRPQPAWTRGQLRAHALPVIRKADGGIHPVLTISSRSGFVAQSDKYQRDMAGASLANYTLLKRGEFAYNKGNSLTYPQGCIYRLERDSALVPNVYFSFRLANDLNADFYAHYFATGMLNRQLAQRISSSARGNGLLNITAREFFSIEIPIPPIQDQERIASALDAMRDEIALLDRQVELLREQKRGLAQKLLSGEIRVEGVDRRD